MIFAFSTSSQLKEKQNLTFTACYVKYNYCKQNRNGSTQPSVHSKHHNMHTQRSAKQNIWFYYEGYKN